MSASINALKVQLLNTEKLIKNTVTYLEVAKEEVISYQEALVKYNNDIEELKSSIKILGGVE